MGWGASTVATKYVHQRLHEVLDMEDNDNCDCIRKYKSQLCIALSQFYAELAENYYKDTGQRIGDPHD